MMVIWRQGVWDKGHCWRDMRGQRPRRVSPNTIKLSTRFPVPYTSASRESESVSHSVASDSVTPWIVAPRLLCPWDSPGNNTGVGGHFLLQRIFLAQGSNRGLQHSGRLFTDWASREGELILNTVGSSTARVWTAWVHLAMGLFP